MAPEPKKRPRRTPLSAEEVANMIAFKKRKEILLLQKFKKSRLFKVLNIFNIACFFIYMELLFCFFGPCNYETHYSHNIVPKHGQLIREDGKSIVSSMDVFCANGRTYNFVIEDFVNTPPKKIKFYIGKDFLLRKDLKGAFENSDTFYRLFSASPILFLCVLVSIISFIAFLYNLNENTYSLPAITVLNVLTLFGILMY